MSLALVIADATRGRSLSPVGALQAHLQSLRELVAGLGAERYCTTPSRASGSIGEHVRHCVDHARALLQGLAGGRLTYDSRLRGTRVETDPAFAANAIDAVCADLESLEGMDLDRLLRLDTRLHDDMDSSALVTTLGREVAFVVQHTIHHCAIVALLLDAQSEPVPARFGYAPSTPVRH